jgi:hypothetical protein
MIGVAISTHQRPGVLARALQGWAAAMPDVLVVNHDVGGDGVAATKNRGLAALMDAGCEHLFLADDDVWPVNAAWAEPYVSDTEPHLMHCWGKSRLIADDGHYTTWKHPRGVLLYVERRVVAAVGGMRLDFGRWGGEHVDWSRRIHAAGLTRHRYADLTAARAGIWHAEDYTRAVPSTVGEAERAALAPRRHELHRLFDGATDFVDYRTG